MDASKGIIFAEFRQATPLEVAQSQGGLLYRAVTWPWHALCKTLGTWQLWYHGPNIRNWKTPLPQQLGNRVALWGGYKEFSFMRSVVSILGRITFIESEDVVAKAFFQQHRNDSIFASSLSMKKFYTLMTSIFPEEIFDENDFMLTCDKIHTKKYRTLLFHSLKQSNINAFIPILKDIIRNTLEQWYETQGDKGIEITNASRIYASRVFSQLLFGDEIESEELANSVTFLNSFIIKAAQNKISDKDTARSSEVFKTVKNVVLEILKRPNLPIFNNETELTSAQKIAIILTLLFAGMETTAALQSYIIQQLALKPAKQNELYLALSEDTEKKHKLKIIQDLFTQSIREFPPAYGVGRTLGQDTCLEYQFANEAHTRKKIFQKDETIILFAEKFANSLSLEDNDAYNAAYVLGNGPHECPGKRLAFAEITYLLKSLLEKYTFSTTTPNPNVSGMFTLTYTDPIYITLSERFTDDFPS